MPTPSINLYGDAGNDISLLKDISNQQLGIGGPMVQAGVSGKGTPFQQAALKQFVSGATANSTAYNKAAGANTDTSGSTAAILEEANSMLGSFTTQDIQMGSGFLRASIQAATTGQQLQNAEDQKFADALMSAGEVVGMILMA